MLESRVQDPRHRPHDGQTGNAREVVIKIDQNRGKAASAAVRRRRLRRLPRVLWRLWPDRMNRVSL